MTQFIVRGRSMEPTFRSGDIVHAIPRSPDAIRPGDVIVFRTSDHRRVVIHRVWWIKRTPDGQPLFVTRGDFSPEFDAPVPMEAVLGVVPAHGGWVAAAWGILLRAGRILRSRLLKLFLPLLYPPLLSHFFPPERVEVGRRRLTLIAGRIVMVEDDTPQRLCYWIHPLFRSILTLNSPSEETL